jgi:peroxiredoxin
MTSVVFAAMLLALALLLVGFAAKMRRSSAAPAPGQMAPGFELETFDGETIRLSDLQGRVVVLNFWSSWCVPCALEAADLERIWRDYRDEGVTVLGIGYTDTAPEALAYIERHGVTYPNGPDRADVISRRYHLAGVPETFVIDASGRIVPLGAADDGGIPSAKIVGPVSEGGAYSPADLRALLDGLVSGESQQ